MNQGEKKSPKKGRDRMKRLLNSKLGIAVLLVLLVVFNLIMFVAYQFMYPSVSIWGQLWGYVESDTFKLITVTLFLPILILLLNASFKIGGAVQERIQKVRDRQRVEQWQCSELTMTAWNELYDLCSEVRYFKKNANEGTRIEDILIKLENYSNKTMDIVSRWIWNFPNLSKNDMNLFLYIIDTLLSSTTTVAMSIMNDADSKKIVELQYSLSRILKGLKPTAHRSLLNVLRLSVQFSDVGTDMRKSIELEIEYIMRGVESLVDMIKTLELEYMKPFSSVNGERGNALQESSKRLEDWGHEHPGQTLWESPEYGRFRDLFEEISHAEAIFTESASHEFLTRFSHILAFVEACTYLTERVVWTREIEAGLSVEK